MSGAASGTVAGPVTGPVTGAISGPLPVLLIEDTPSLQMVYRSVLQTAGHMVRVASTAAEGMRVFQDSGAVTVLPPGW